MRAAAVVLVALVAQEPGEPPPPRPPEHFRLTVPVVDSTHGFEFRLPEGAKRVPEDSKVRIHYWDVLNDEAHGGCIGLNVVLDQEKFDDAVTSAREWYAKAGMAVQSERRDNDAVLGTGAQLILAGKQDGFDLVYALLFLRRGGRGFYFQFEFERAAEPLWRRTVAAVTRSFRTTTVRDGRLAPPPGARERVVAGLTLSTEMRGAKGPAEADTKRLGTELAAGLAFARALTGGDPLNPLPPVHCFESPKAVQLVIPSDDPETPTAVYVPEGRLILAHLGKTRRPGKGCADRHAAAMWAYLDASTGSMWGLYPWIETGAIEAAFAARADGDALVPRLRDTTVGVWIKKSGWRSQWPEVAAFVRRRTALADERDQAYAIALVLAAHASDDPTRRGVLPRYFAALREHGDPDGALDRALEGVDLAAWDAAARALLKAG